MYKMQHVVVNNNADVPSSSAHGQHAISNNAAEPQFDTRVTPSSAHGQPTIDNNVETQFDTPTFAGQGAGHGASSTHV